MFVVFAKKCYIWKLKTIAFNSNSTMKKEKITPKEITIRPLKSVEGLAGDQVRSLMLAEGEAIKVDCLNWPDFPYAPNVDCRVAYTPEALVVMFDVEESHVKAVTLENNGPVWEDSCVEVFVANPCGEGYFNFEVNCIGALLAASRRSRTEANMFDDERLAKVCRYGSLPHEKVDSKGDGQRWWMVEIIPFEVLGLEGAPEQLRANFYKCGDNCERTHFLSWSPIGLPTPNFHCPDFFGAIKLSK